MVSFICEVFKDASLLTAASIFLLEDKFRGRIIQPSVPEPIEFCSIESIERVLLCQVIDTHLFLDGDPTKLTGRARDMLVLLSLLVDSDILNDRNLSAAFDCT
jgi:hypothetical protein